MRAALAVILIATAAPARAEAQVIPPHASFTQLAWSNGFGAGFYDATQRRVKGFRDHLYASGAHELMYDAYWGLRVGGQELWLTSRPVEAAGYDGDSGIAQVTQSFLGVKVTERYLAPYGVDAPALVMIVEVENTTSSPLSDSALFAIDNVHTGGGADGSLAETITWRASPGEYEEKGATGVIVHRALPAATTHACSPNNPYTAVSSGAHMVSTDASGTVDDAVPGFEWSLDGLAPGEKKTFAVVLGFRADGDRASLDASLASLGSDPAAILDAARADWAAFQARATEPAGLSPDEHAVYRRQLAILRMGQVREPGRGHGAMVASLPPGHWNIAWVRDQAYAVSALVRAGLYAEAKDALAFWLGAQAGTWVCCDSTGGPWVGAAYGISVVRYTGDGSEEADSNADGPNVEFDGFGLVLGALDEYVAASGDLSLVSDNADRVFAKTADVIAGLVEPATGLVRADSSIWETHWYNGGKKHYAYTDVAAVRGLRAAADLAMRAGRANDASRYAAAATAIATAIDAKLVDPGTHALRGNTEESAWMDSAPVEAFNWDVLAADGDVARASLDQWKANLWNGLVGHGYHRDDDGGFYDVREWIVIDLRMATALRRAGRPDEAAQLIEWITQQARANAELIPENFDRTTGDYAGEVPMVGFGAGAYVTALWERGGQPVGGDGVIGPDAGPNENPAPSGCCDAHGGASGSIALVMIMIVFRMGSARRRRR
ncbi:MAG TPA: glycoside hydrolase family 15 protein [Kofleriaceae bacterium]|nr:glycoside hydrolase family 15 protein [Kofleriaceae bacterium]